MNGLKGYAETGQVCVPVRQTLRERLEEQKRNAEDHLASIKSAIEFMDKNPDFENFHNLIGKVGF